VSFSDPFAHYLPPQRRMSTPALVTVGAIHVLLLWLVLQSMPVAKAVREPSPPVPAITPPKAIELPPE